MTGNPCIFLITDDEKEEAQVSHILSKYHFSNPIIRLHRAAEALRRFGFASVDEAASPPELIIMSMKDEVVQTELAVALRSGRWREVPLILLCNPSAGGETPVRTGMERTFCVSKPVGFFKLLEAMQKVGMYWVLWRSPPPDAKSGK